MNWKYFFVDPGAKVRLALPRFSQRRMTFPLREYIGTSLEIIEAIFFQVCDLLIGPPLVRLTSTSQSEVARDKDSHTMGRHQTCALDATSSYAFADGD